MMNLDYGFAQRSRVFGLVAAAGLTILSSACATINYDAATVQAVVSMNRVAPAASYERVGAFEAQQRPVFVISQLITVVDVDLERDIQRALQRTGGDAILNLRIHEEYDVVDVFIALVVGGWVNTRLVELEGDVVRWNTGFLENGGEQWLGQTCREVAVENPDGSSRTAHVCIAPEEGVLGTDVQVGLAP